MLDDCHDDVQVLRDSEGWAVRCGDRWLKRFAGGNEFQALGRACEWSSRYAEAHGVGAWFLQAGRRTPITVPSRVRPAKATIKSREDEHSAAR
jgi:hypothetical protein